MSELKQHVQRHRAAIFVNTPLFKILL